MKNTIELDTLEMDMVYLGKTTGLEETYGYTSSLDNISNMRNLAMALGVDPSNIEIKLRINHKDTFDTTLAEADDVINNWLETS